MIHSPLPITIIGYIHFPINIDKVAFLFQHASRVSSIMSNKNIQLNLALIINLRQKTFIDRNYLEC